MSKFHVSSLNRHRIFNVSLYSTTILLTIIVKGFYRNSNHTQLLFILKPVTKIVESFFCVPFNFDEDIGFFSPNHTIIIGKNCAGINFFVIVLCMFIFTFIKRFKSIKLKLPAFLIFIASAYFITVVINSFRIISAIFILNLKVIPDFLDKNTVHKAVGIIIYFFFLVISYYSLNKIVSKVSEKL